jgi:hypothetical protein
MELPKSVFYVLNPEKKAFEDSVSYNREICQLEFVKSWFSGWGIQPTGYEANTIFKMFERNGFKIMEVKLPKNICDKCGTKLDVGLFCPNCE